MTVQESMASIASLAVPERRCALAGVLTSINTSAQYAASQEVLCTPS